MSSLPENELDLEKLFLPAWAQEPAAAKNYAHFEGEAERPRRDDRHGPRPPRRDGGGPPRGDRPRGDRPGQPRREGDRQGFGGKDKFAPRRNDQRERFERPAPPPPPPEIDVLLVPDEKGVESLARQIKTTGRAYPLFDIARLILQKPERYSVKFSVEKKPDGSIVQPLFLCALDETLWLSADEAVAHVLQKHFATFYNAERTATEPPKGTYTFVAQCGLSGTVLGPPNHHDYQNQLRKLHAERFSRMPFDVYKARVKIVRDEAIVKKWVEDQSWKTEYACLNIPEPLKLPTMEAVEKHFRETHKDTIIKSVETQTLGGVAARNLRSPGLAQVARQAWEDQRRFPLQIATTLSQQFARQGLQFFKVNKTLTHVSVARPSFLDLETTPVSEGIRKLVEFINSHPKCTRRKILDQLAPAPAPAPAAPVKAEPAAAPIAGETAPAAETTAPPPAEPAGPTPEQTAVISDLHWLIHQGHVIEFASGILETAKKPAPRPPKPEPKPAEAKPAPEAAPAAETAPVAEVVTSTEAVAVEAAPEIAATPAAEAVVSPEAPAESKPAEPSGT